MVLIECICCRECFEPQDIEYADNSALKEACTLDEIEELQDDEIRFDCPECDEVMYLSDCSIF